MRRPFMNSWRLGTKNLGLFRGRAKWIELAESSKRSNQAAPPGEPGRRLN